MKAPVYGPPAPTMYVRNGAMIIGCPDCPSMEAHEELVAVRRAETQRMVERGVQGRLTLS